jgi:hypothetical protein
MHRVCLAYKLFMVQSTGPPGVSASVTLILNTVATRGASLRGSVIQCRAASCNTFD